MTRTIDCPGRPQRPAVEEEQRQMAYDWHCQHQLQLQLVAYTDTIDERAERLAAYEKAMLAAALLKVL